MAKEALRILVVDDEEGMRLAVERALRNFVCRVEEADAEVSFRVELSESGEDALAKIAAAPPELMLLDYKLGGITGIDVLNRILEKRLDILVVMITAYASLETAVQATKLGAYDFLAKPFTPEEMKTVVRKAVRHHILQRQARNLAEERKKIRFQFLSVLAHELKAPLAAVEGYLRILQDEKLASDPESTRRMVERSLVRLEGMSKLIFDLLDLTRIESGQKQRTLKPVDAVEVARRAIETAQPAARDKGVSISLVAEAPVVLQADPGEIEIILNNLVSNAVKYNKAGGTVEVRCRAEAGQAVLQVADSGIGIAPEDTGRLFLEFSRIKNEHTRNILGSGLGLSIVKRLAHLYGGAVQVESQPGVGSTFTVRLSTATSPAGSSGEARASDIEI
ncbi:MAG: response regulator [Myxococcales bacterium]|nr:response regulator [Myxococcales bacterium]